MRRFLTVAPIAFVLCHSWVMSLQISAPQQMQSKNNNNYPPLIISSRQQSRYGTSILRFRRKGSSLTKSTCPTKFETTLFSTPTNAIDAEIIKSKRTTLINYSSNTNQRRRNSSSALHSSTSSNGNSPSRAKEDTSSTTAITPADTAISFLQAVDTFGMNLKPLAIQAYEKSNAINGESKQTTLKSLLHRIKSNILWMMYIIYRGYRGFFVILPAVFKEVYRQLEESDLVMDAYGDEEEEVVGNNGEVKPTLRLRTKITTSVLTSILTLSYVVSGGIRVVGKFIKTFTNTTSVESSLEAAADEMVDNEDKLSTRYNKE